MKANERNAIFKFIVQRKNPATGRWVNVSVQPTLLDAEFVVVGIVEVGFAARIVVK